MRRWQKRLGAWLGAVAVAVGCYLPYHFTTDILHAVGHLHGAEHATLAAHEHAGGAGHAHQHDHGQHHHHDGCAICVAFSAALAGTTLPPSVTVAPPRNDAVTHLSLAATTAPLRQHTHTPYAPRAPPALA